MFFINHFDHGVVSTPVPIVDIALDDNEWQILEFTLMVGNCPHHVFLQL